MPKIDDALNTYQALIQEMALKVRKMHEIGLEVIETGDREKALHIIKLDEFVNHYEEEINDRAQEILSLLSPVATDLRIVIAGIKTANDLERIADYAKNISKYVIKSGQIDEKLAKNAQKIGEAFLTMFDKAMKAYAERDVKSALEIPNDDMVINELFALMIEDLQNALNQHQMLSEVIPVVRLLRNFERAGDHTKNICEHLIFLEKDQHIDLD